MATQPITIHISEAAARAYQKASPEDVRHLKEMLELWLTDPAHGVSEPFEEYTTNLEDVVKEIGQKAQEKGLSDSTIKSILNEPKT